MTHSSIWLQPWEGGSAGVVGLVLPGGGASLENRTISFVGRPRQRIVPAQQGTDSEDQDGYQGEDRNEPQPMVRIVRRLRIEPDH